MIYLGYYPYHSYHFLHPCQNNWDPSYSFWSPTLRFSFEMFGRRRKNEAGEVTGPDIELNSQQPPTSEKQHRYNHEGHLVNHNGHKVTKGIKPDGESGRRGIHPLQFLYICFRSTSTASMVVNVLWPFVPIAIALHFARPKLHIWIFALNYIAMVPTANLVGFAGQELARKLPKVFGS